MLKEWCKFRYGIFPENGFSGDNLYPDVYQEGNNTLASKGCVQQDVLCPHGQVYNRAAPTKQNLLCAETSGIGKSNSSFRILPPNVGHLTDALEKWEWPPKINCFPVSTNQARPESS